MDRTLVWWWFCASLPVRMLLLYIFTSARLCALNFECKPCNTTPAHSLHVQQDRFQCGLQSAYTCTGVLCGRVIVRYSRDQLLVVKPARLTPDLTSRLRDVGIGFDLPRKRSLRGGRRKQKQIQVVLPFFGVSNKHVSMKRRNESTVNFDNLITVPTQTASPHKSG